MALDTQLRLADAVDINADAQGTALDLGSGNNIQGVVEFRMWVKAVTGTSPTLLMYIEESSDNATWYKVAVFDVWGTKTTTDQYVACAYISKRYIRYNADVGGTSPVYNDVTIYGRGLGVTVPFVPSGT
ncbi:MAG: hypothetical protein C4521_01810 [Actinobacteria bacterium]|nr:MAG: hypothetical protein C4521_01810 [Actinomycetota bacterium]